MGIKSIIAKYIITPLTQRKRKKNLKKCGDKVHVGSNCTFIGHIECGNNVFINDGAYFVSTMAKLIIKDHCMFGPNVTIYTGDHAIGVVGKHIIDVTDADKLKLGGNYDQDVIIEDGCWIGTRAIILKGVRIGRGCVIGAGAIVTKDVPDYSVYVGIPPNVRITPRFTEEEIIEHERILYPKQPQGN